MILNDCREEWERGLEEVGMFPSSTGGTYVILCGTHKCEPDGDVISTGWYSLHRYFAVGNEWQCSVDVNGGDLEQCVRKLSELMTS